MKSPQLRFSKLSLGLVVALAASPAFAQSATSSGVGGFVTDASGAPVAGADVTITNTATGAVSHATTSTNGYYSVRGLQVGGPYTVSVSKGGATQASEGVYIELNTVASVNERLGVSASDLGSITVTGNRALLNTFNSDNKGVGTTISGRALETTPAGNRSLDDIARLDPRVQVVDQGTGAISMAGVNSRYNTISVDGLSQGDPFGLNANGMPYTGSPISPDTIAAYNISTTDYDVGSDTVGAKIDAVTKSGTNDFHGSVYYDYKNASSMVGKRDTNGDGKQDKYLGFGKDQTFGVTIGGPILKDKLFFFASYEDQKVSDLAGISSDGVSNGYVTADQVQQVIDTAKQVGMQPGSYGNAALQLEDKRYLGKLDWNIADGHRAALTYQRTEESLPKPYDNGAKNVVLSSHWYNVDSVTNNLALQVFDDWTDSFSTEAKFSYQKFDQTNGAAINQPHVQVITGGGNVYLGEDRYRAENAVNTKTFNASLAGVWNVQDHTIKFGADYQSEDIADLFGRDLHGVYVFNSIADFAAGKYSSYTVTTIPSGVTLDQIAGSWTYTQLSPFVQDTWQVTDKFSLVYGVRMDIPGADHAPPLNQAYENAFGFANNATLGSKNEVVEPRVGFNYQIDSEDLLQLRGGVGLFQSTPPVVWLTNPYLNNGITSLVSHTSNNPANAAFSADPNAQNIPAGTAANPTNVQVDALDPNFKLPTVWKSTLGFDAALPWWGLIGTIEYQYLKNKDAIAYLAPNIGTPDGTLLPDGRYQYWTTPNTFSSAANGKNNGKNPAFNPNSTLLTNTNAGGSNALTLAVTKPMDHGFSGNVSLTLANATEVNQGSSSQASSNYAYVARTNANELIATQSDYVVHESVKASLNWEHAFFGDNKTSISLFYNGHTGTPYSWIFGGGYNGDVNGDGIGNEDLAYIPLVNDPKVSYGNASPQLIAEFNKFIDSDAYLRTHRGQIASRNSDHLPWSNELDLGFQQELPGFLNGDKFKIRLDVYNFLNMLNKDWGVVESNGGYDTRYLANVASIKNGQYVYDLGTAAKPSWQTLSVYDSSATYPQRVVSRWSALLSLKYEF